MPYRRLLTFVLACSFLTLGIAQETDTEPIHPLYEAVVFPDRSLSRRLEQAARLFETGRSSEAAIVLGGILENADVVFLRPEESEETAEDQPIRTLHLTVSDYVIDRLRKLPREARDSYTFQFEPMARRLLDNAVATGSLDEVQQVARKYFPTASGASATILVALTQFERGDHAAAFLTLDRLRRLHSSLPDTLEPVLEQMLEEVQNRLRNVADQPPQSISESAWLERVGWRLPAGSSSQNTSTKATAPLLEQNWTVPMFARLPQERDIDSLSKMLESGDDVYIPASQPLLVGDLFITRTFGETIAVDVNTGKRLWAASEPEYRFPEGTSVYSLHSGSNPRMTSRLFFWHNRVAQQLSSDGERLFCIDGHDFHTPRQFARLPNLAGRGEDLRYDPGNTLTARDMRTGRILWQAGKFPYVQKYINALFALPAPAATPSSNMRQPQVIQADIDETIFTDDDKTFKDTWFLGAPLPLHGRLYVIGETDGVLQLFVLESQTGRLIARQAFAHAQSSVTANIVRRAYPLFPSTSGGIVVCPTGNGLVAALDAVTLLPIWCFSYAPAQTSTPANIRMPNLQRMLPMMNVNEHNFRQLFAESGWQMPRLIIDGQRVLVAPPDRAALYCLDLLSGELLWEQTVSRPNALYVACVHNDKVFVVTPINLLVLDMNTGKEVTTYKVRFPPALKPAGVGVHSGDQYFIPFTEGQLAVADLNEGKLTWLAVSGSLPAADVSDSVTTGDPIDSPWIDIFGEQQQDERDIFAPDLVADDIFRRPIRFGNLVGIKGRFFSQSPMQIASFDQKEPLRQQAEASLRVDPNDPKGLLQQGRIFKAEGKIAEAIDSFRASLRSKPSPEAADALRRNLLEAMQNDYPSWSNAKQELESLTEFSDEWGIILYVQMEGILQSGTADDLASVLEKVFAFGHDPTILIPVGSDHSAQLHRALGSLIDQHIIRGNRPALRAVWEELAETFYRRLAENPAGFTKPPHISELPAQWLRNTVYLPHDIQRWLMFTNVFRNTSAEEKAKQVLWKEYERYRLPVALDLREKTSVVSEWSELSVPFVWRSGFVDVRDAPASATRTSPSAQGSAGRSSIDRLLNIARNPNASPRLSTNQLTIPFLGASSSELAAFNYTIVPLATGTTEFFLCCSDPSGQELWRLALPSTRYMGTRAVNTHGSEHVLYIKGCQNFLLLVLENSITAIDVSAQSEAKILWSKTLSSTLVNQQNSRDRRMDQRLATNRAFPQKSVFVSPRVIAIWDANCVYGLDPLTGQTLWVRKISHENCSILGDNENLFLVFPDVRQVIAVDPASGRELESGPLPDGTAYYTYGTNIVFASRLGTTDDYSLHICDLRVLYDRRSRALRVDNSLPSEMLHNRLTRNMTLVQMLQGDRFLSIANWGTKSLQIHDLLTKKKLLPEGNTVLRFVSEGNMGTMRCDVEFVGDRILVLFTKDSNMRPAQAPARQTGEPSRHITYTQISNVPGMSIGAGEMMLFDSAGNPCWAEATKIEMTTRLWDIPDHLPVVLFAVSVTTRETRGSTATNSYATTIMGVDKRSGELRFRRELPPRGDRPFLQSFRVIADPLAQEIMFVTPNAFPPEVVKAVFTDE